MRKKLLHAISFTVLVAGSLLFWRYRQAIEDPVEVEVLTVKRNNLVSSVIAQGKISAERIEVMKAPIEGIIQKGHQLKEGDEVRKGDILVVFRRPNEELNTLRQELELAEIDFELILEEKSQAQELLEAKAISRKQLRELEIREYKQELAVTAIKDRMERRAMSAPFSGVVMKKNFQAGQKVEAGAELMTLVDMNTLMAMLWVSEYDISKVQLRQKVNLTGDTFSGSLNGRITSISRMADDMAHQGVNTFSITSSIENNERGTLILGSTVEASIITEEKENVVAIPLESVLYRDGEQVVFIINDTIAHLRKVSTGISSQKRVEITDGLEIGELVVTRGTLELRDGRSVTILTE